MIADKIKAVKLKIARCCEQAGRPADSVRLICVTKEADAGQALEALACGVKDLGENRVQELASKYTIIGDKAAWHLIGHLQTNKVKDAVKISSMIQSLDSVRLAKAIDKEAARLGKVQAVLVEVNTSGEESKFGLKPDAISDFLKEVSLYQHIDIKGFMTMAPEVEDPENARPYFRALRELRDKINAIHNTRYSILSMGMSNDFEVAIEEGSSVVRIGRAIFK